MRKLLQTLITLPLLALPLAVLKPAAAAPFTPLAAIELLAKSKASDARCRHLQSGEAQELADYLARAEIAAASQTSVGETQSAIAAGRSAGAAVLCGADSLAEVRGTLDAAREAMVAIGGGEPANDETAVATTAVVPDKTAPAAPVVKLVKPKTTALKALPPAPRLGSYSAAAMGYYLDQRCRHLSAKEAKRYYAGILRGHKSALAASGKPAVAALLRSAEAQANGVACGTRSAALVKTGFARALN